MSSICRSSDASSGFGADSPPWPAAASDYDRPNDAVTAAAADDDDDRITLGHIIVRVVAHHSRLTLRTGRDVETESVRNLNPNHRPMYVFDYSDERIECFSFCR